MPRFLKVGELARETGRTVRAIHLYEQMGLIRSVGRTRGRYRLFAEATLVRMAWIQHLQTFGLSLTQIQDLIGSIDEIPVGREAMGRMRELYRGKLEQIRQTIRTLQGLERELTNTLAYLEVCKECDAPKPKEACVDCKRERPVEKPVLVSGLHADIGWIDDHRGANGPFSFPRSAATPSVEDASQDHRESRS